MLLTSSRRARRSTVCRASGVQQVEPCRLGREAQLLKGVNPSSVWLTTGVNLVSVGLSGDLKGPPSTASRTERHVTFGAEEYMYTVYSHARIGKKYHMALTGWVGKHPYLYLRIEGKVPQP